MTRPKRIDDRVAHLAVHRLPAGLNRGWVLGTVVDVGDVSGLVTVRWDDNLVALYAGSDRNLVHVDEIPIDERWWLTEADRAAAIRDTAADWLDAMREAWPDGSDLAAFVRLDDAAEAIREGRADNAARALLGLDPHSPEEHERAQADADAAAAQAEHEAAENAYGEHLHNGGDR